MNILPRAFYTLDTVEVARNLLGKKLIRRIGNEMLIGIISECEAYRSDDPACHAFKGQTPRNSMLFGEVGHAYVYLSYGLHFCLNIVARDKDNYPSGGVLLRGVLPIEGINLMQKFRPQVQHTILTNGPGKLTQAFNITLNDNGVDVTDHGSHLFVADAPQVNDEYVHRTPRIGISQATDKLWRFVLAKNFSFSSK